MISVLLSNYFEKKYVAYMHTHSQRHIYRQRMIKPMKQKEKGSFWRKIVIKFPVLFLKFFSKYKWLIKIKCYTHNEALSYGYWVEVHTLKLIESWNILKPNIRKFYRLVSLLKKSRYGFHEYDWQVLETNFFFSRGQLHNPVSPLLICFNLGRRCHWKWEWFCLWGLFHSLILCIGWQLEGQVNVFCDLGLVYREQSWNLICFTCFSETGLGR